MRSRTCFALLVTAIACATPSCRSGPVSKQVSAVTQIASTRPTAFEVEFKSIDYRYARKPLSEIRRFAAWEKKGGGVEVFRSTLSPDEARAFFRASNGPVVRLLDRTRVSVSNGERRAVKIEAETAYVDGYLKTDPPGELPPEHSSYEPTVGVVVTGLSFGFQPSAKSQQSTIILQLDCRAAALRSMKKAPWPGAPLDRDDLLIDVPRVIRTAWSTKLCMTPTQWQVLKVPLPKFDGRMGQALFAVRLVEAPKTPLTP